MRKFLMALGLLMPFTTAQALADANMESADTPGPANPAAYSKEKREAFRQKALERCRKQHGTQAISVEIDLSRNPPRSWCLKS